MSRRAARTTEGKPARRVDPVVHDARAGPVCVYQDIGVLGGAAIDKRPGLMTALDALRLHGAAVLLTAKRDRLVRDAVIAAVLERVVESHGAVVQTADDVASGVSPEDKLLRTPCLVYSAFELATAWRNASVVASPLREY